MSNRVNKPYPVTLFVYKRSHSLKQVLNLIRHAGIAKVYIFADGPKNTSDKSQTTMVKQTIQTYQEKFPALKLITSYAAHNLGLRRSIIKGLDTVFAQEKASIILEDDCIPSPDFFRFTAEMLDKYENDPIVMSITGTSVAKDVKYSYYFSKYPHIWGWATWKRAWAIYDNSLASLITQTWRRRSHEIWHNPLMRWYWQTMLTLTRKGQIDTWDFQWSFAHFYNHGLAVVPSVNLITNTGFDNVATNTKTRSSVASLKTGKISWPLRHPPDVQENISMSKIIEKRNYRNLIAFVGMLRQLFYWNIKQYAHRH